MRILLIGDIHSNLEALDACLTAAPVHDLVVNLGDIVGYGASPNEVTERSRQLGKHCVRGNHDKAVTGLMEVGDFNPVAGLAALWTREHLKPENLEWLRGLPQGPIRIDETLDIQCVHGSPLDEDDYVVTLRDALEPLMAATVAITFFGHSHVQGVFCSDQEEVEVVRPTYPTVGRAETWDLPLDRNAHYLINPGSVGQPRDGDWRAAFALFDSDRYHVAFHRVPYNLKGAQDRIVAANLPQRLATRLAAGR